MSGIEISVVTIDKKSASASGSNLENALAKLNTSSSTQIQLNEISELVITGGQIKEADWRYIFEHNGLHDSESPDQFTKLSVFRAQGTGRGTGVIPDVVYSTYKFFPNSIRKLEIPDGITSIGDLSFFGCHMLTDLTIPSSVKRIGDSAFMNCHGLQNITLPNGLNTIETAAFHYCNGLKQIKIPDSVTEIGTNAFSQCYALKEVTLPKNLTKISSGAFSSCTSLEHIIIPDSVTIINNGAFAGCNKLQEIKFPSSLESIGNYLGENLSSISGAFAGCSSLTKVTIPGHIKTIGACAFFNCFNLEEVVIENGVERIDRGAFQYTIINKIVIPNSVKEIGLQAFNKCSKLEEITIPASVSTMRYNAFSDCPILSRLNLLVHNEEEITVINTPNSVADRNPFLNVPTPRHMSFYMEDGTPLSDTTNPSFDDMAAAYIEAEDNDSSDNLWWDWQIVKVCSVNSHLTNLAGSNEAEVWRNIDGNYTTILTPSEATEEVIYALPEDVVVKIGDHTASRGTEYTYDQDTGILSIDASYINENIEIKAEAIQTPKLVPTPTPEPTVSPTPEPSPNPTASPSPTPTLVPTANPSPSP
ncbi:MAG: leucine-rich repeat protein, partial [Lachnospiraceae bacterium]|nr:leucine-rich repeat protein [Lachnospiraceae bacterium]